MERSRTSKLITCVVMAATLICYALPVLACGPFFQQAVFSYCDHPDFPLSKFAAGDLGVIQPTYARSYLIAAYRYLIGKPLNAVEQKAFLDLWQVRLTQGNQYPDEYTDSKQLKDWLSLRKQITGNDGPQIKTYRNTSNAPNAWNNFLNCPPAAFSRAAQTLNERIAKCGAASDSVKQWVQGQDAVFCHCGGPTWDYQTKTTTPEGPFPQPLAAERDKLLVADRAYQIASADFYAMQYDKAAAEFEAIAADNNSPWQSLGLYMAARALTRKGTIPDTIDKEALSQAALKLQAILKDPQLSALHASALGLLEFIKNKTEPENRLVSLAHEMFEPAKQNVLMQSLYDYTFLLDNYFPDADADAKTPRTPMPEALKEDDLTNWLAVYQDNSSQAKTVALEKWRQSHSQPWLLAALQGVDGKGQIDQELLSAAEKIPPSSSAYPSIRLQLIRLLIAANHMIEAKAMLDKMTADNLPPSAKNNFAYYQMLLAPSLIDFVKLAVRCPAVYTYDPDSTDDVDKIFALKDYQLEKRACFVPDGAYVLNFDTPLDKLKLTALSTTVAGEPRFDLTQAAWTRAVLLKRYDLAQDLVPLLKKLKPQLAPMYDAFVQAPAPADKQFAAYFLMLRNPGSRPFVTQGAPREVEYGKLEDYGDNWWGAQELAGNLRIEDTGKAAKPIMPPSFFSQADLKAASNETTAIKTLGEAPNILTAAVLDYAKNHPADARIPEALYRCVRATKLGSTDSNTKTYSRRAFTLLHKQYGNNPWTKKTPFYYGG